MIHLRRRHYLALTETHRVSLQPTSRCKLFQPVRGNRLKQLLFTIFNEFGRDYDIKDEQSLMFEGPNLDEYLQNQQAYRKS